VNRIVSAENRLREASDLPAVLDAAYNAFEDMLTVFGAYEDPAYGTFAAFVMSAASAADGRDAILFAPSLPPHRLGGPPAPEGDAQPGDSAYQAARALAGLTRLLAARLAQAAGSAPDARDRAACAGAWRDACYIHVLLTGAEP